MILVSEHTARWLLHAAERNSGLAFNLPDPHYCKLCDQAVTPAQQAAHLKAHRQELDRLVRLRRREATKNLRQVNRLRRETARV